MDVGSTAVQYRNKFYKIKQEFGPRHEETSLMLMTRNNYRVRFSFVILNLYHNLKSYWCDTTFVCIVDIVFVDQLPPC